MKVQFKNIVLIITYHLQFNQILALNNPLKVDMPLNQPTNQPTKNFFLKTFLGFIIIFKGIFSTRY